MEEKRKIIESRCPECGGLNGEHANHKCSLMSLEYAQNKIIAIEQKYIKQQAELSGRYGQWAEQMRHKIAHWYTKFVTVKQENNKLRRKLYNSQSKQTPHT